MSFHLHRMQLHNPYLPEFPPPHFSHFSLLSHRIAIGYQAELPQVAIELSRQISLICACEIDSEVDLLILF